MTLLGLNAHLEQKIMEHLVKLPMDRRAAHDMGKGFNDIEFELDQPLWKDFVSCTIEWYCITFTANQGTAMPIDEFEEHLRELPISRQGKARSSDEFGGVRITQFSLYFNEDEDVFEFFGVAKARHWH